MQTAKSYIGLALAAITLMVMGFVRADSLYAVQVQESTNLQADGQLARNRQVPLLIMFAMQDCPYCVVVREEFLNPMLISGDYDNKVVIREIHTDSYLKLRDFNGKPVTSGALARRYDVSLVPTVVFVDAEGRELAKRLIGITTVDFYGGFLDEAIEASLIKLRQQLINQAMK